MSQDKVIRIEDPASPGAAIILDGRYFPVIFQAWIGQPTMEMAKSYFEARGALFDRAQAERTKVFIVSDLAKTGSPTATVRKYIADTAKTEDDRDELLGYATCVPSAIMRGVVTALKWIIGDEVKPVILFASMDAAIEKARQGLETHGINVQPFTYNPPY